MLKVEDINDLKKLLNIAYIININDFGSYGIDNCGY